MNKIKIKMNPRCKCGKYYGIRNDNRLCKRCDTRVKDRRGVVK